MKGKKTSLFYLLHGFFFFLLIDCEVRAEGTYLDEMKQEILKQDAEAHQPELPENSSYTEIQKTKVEEKDHAAEVERMESDPGYHPYSSYSDQVRKELLEQPAPASSELYSEIERSKLKAVDDGGGAIQAFHEHRSDLKAVKKGEITRAYGLRYGISLQKNISGNPNVVARDFNDVYGQNYAPDVTLFYEHQFFRNEYAGSFGLITLLEVAYYHGLGKFAFPLQLPGGGGDFPIVTSTRFQFFQVPITVGAVYRLSLFNYVRPYVLAGPTIIPFVEMRSDSLSGHRGHSQAFLLSFGVSLLLDWLTPKASWDLYTSQNIKQYFLTLDYSRLTPLSGDVRFNVSGISLGLTFEY